jgi:type II secretory pathway predicted ATPase ExeA
MPTDPFGFSENPFADAPDPRFLYSGRSHREAVARLRRALETREPFALLAGLPGVGKTVAVETALACAGPYVRVTVAASPALTRERFLEQVLSGFAPGGDDRSDPAQPADGLEARLRAVTAAGRTAVLVVEDAHDLDRPLLEDLRLYSNLEAGGRALLQIVLVGRPALEETLSDPACDTLRRRIAVGCRLDPLSAEETEAYIRHRVAVAGDAGPCPFTTEACRAVHRLTHGIPREIHRIAGEALALANTAGEATIAASHVGCAVVMLGFRSVAGPALAAEESVLTPEESVFTAEESVLMSEESVPPAEEPVLAAEEPFLAAEEPFLAAEESVPVARKRVETTAGPVEPSVAIEWAVPEAAPPVSLEHPLPRPGSEEHAAHAGGPVASGARTLEAPLAAEPVETPAAPRATDDAATALRRARRRREAPPRDHSPRAARAPGAPVLTAAALLLVVAGSLALIHSMRGRVPSRPTTTPMTAAPAAVPAVAPVAETPKRAPVKTNARRTPTRAPVSAAAPVTAEPKRAPAAAERSYGVEVGTFLSESRAQTECDRLAAAIQRPCRVVPSDDDAYAVVVGPVVGAKEATRLSVDLAGRGLVNEARVVGWAPGGARH